MPQNDDQLVTLGMELIKPVRPHLSAAHRASQRQTLVNLCTRTNLNIRDSTTTEFTQKLGILLELLVVSEPEYLHQTEDERQVSDFLLALMRPGSLLRVGKAKKGLKNPDDIETKIVGSTAIVGSIVEIKHSSKRIAKKALTDQLEAFDRSLRTVVESLQKRFSLHRKPPESDLYPWPEVVTEVQINPALRRILYLTSASAKPLINWEVRVTVFSSEEVSRLANSERFWKKLVAKGGAAKTPTERQEKVTIHRSPNVVASVRRHDEGQGAIMTQASQVREQQFATICGKCEDEPLLYVVREGENNAPFFIIVRGNDGEVRRVFLGQKCAQEHILAEVPKLRAQALEAIGQTEQKFPGKRDYASGRAAVDENFRRIVVNDAALPERFLIGLKGLQGLRNRTQLAWAALWIEDAKSVLEGVSSQRASQVRERLIQLEAKRLDMLRSSDMVQEETVTSFTASPDDEPIEYDHVVERVITAYHLFNAAVRFHDDAGKAKVQAENTEHDDETRDDLLVKLSASTGVELKAPEKSKPAVKKEEQSPPTVEDAVEAKAKDGGVPVEVVRLVGANGDTRQCPDPKCGKMVAVRYQRCIECGADMKPPAAKSEEPTCPSCGSIDPGPGKVCGHCGADLRKVTPEATPATEQPFQPTATEAEASKPAADPAAIAAVDGPAASSPAPVPASAPAPAAPAPAATPPVTAAAAAVPSSVFCIGCGYPNPANAQFCNSCGQPMPARS